MLASLWRTSCLTGSHMQGIGGRIPRFTGHVLQSSIQRPRSAVIFSESPCEKEKEACKLSWRDIGMCQN